MIDIESEVFSIISDMLKNEYPNIFVTSEYVAIPAAFPAVSIIEEDNFTDTRTLTQENQENHAYVMYEVNIYSNKKSGKKSEAKKICESVDSKLQSLGFIRTSLTPVPNLDSASIYRIVSRYRAKVSKDKVIYR